MFAIFLMFIMIVVMVSVLVIVYYKFVKISDNWARKLEVLEVQFIQKINILKMKKLIMSMSRIMEWHILMVRLLKEQ